MKETYYFSHDCNARNDEKILMLRAEHGMEGYGVYWALIEMMFESAETCLYHNKVKGLAISYNITITLLEDIINTCIAEELFSSDDETFWSESLRRRKDKYHEIKQKRSEAGKKGMAKRWGTDNTVITPLLDNNNTDITKDNKGKEIESKGNKIKEDVEEEPSTTTSKYQIIIDIWNELNLAQIRSINSNRLKLVQARVKEFSLEEIIQAIKSINNSSFLKGQNKNNWIITFDWFIKPNNFVKVLEGNYLDKGANNNELENRGENKGNSGDAPYDYDKFFN